MGRMAGGRPGHSSLVQLLVWSSWIGPPPTRADGGRGRPAAHPGRPGAGPSTAGRGRSAWSGGRMDRIQVSGICGEPVRGRIHVSGKPPEGGFGRAANGQDLRVRPRDPRVPVVAGAESRGPRRGRSAGDRIRSDHGLPPRTLDPRLYAGSLDEPSCGSPQDAHSGARANPAIGRSRDPPIPGAAGGRSAKKEETSLLGHRAEEGGQAGALESCRLGGRKAPLPTRAFGSGGVGDPTIGSAWAQRVR
jgi:hypothetical protein